MIIVDVETTGIDPRRHAIVSVGALEFENPENTFYAECQIFESAEITQEALTINGFTEAEITDSKKPTQAVTLQKFLLWTRGCEERTLAGHNVHFDLYFLKFSALREELDWDIADRIIDTHSLVYQHLVSSGKQPPAKNNRSGINSLFVQDYVGLPGQSAPHNALTDARWTAEAISRLLHGENLLSQFTQAEMPSYLER